MSAENLTQGELFRKLTPAERQSRYRARHRAKVLKRGREQHKGWYETKEGWMAVRLYHLKRKFGLTGEQYDAMVAAQGGVCAICRNPETATRQGIVKLLAVDHCHATGKIRGLLCNACNAMLGHGRDDVTLLKAAIAYLGG